MGPRVSDWRARTLSRTRAWPSTRPNTTRVGQSSQGRTDELCRHHRRRPRRQVAFRKNGHGLPVGAVPHRRGQPRRTSSGQGVPAQWIASTRSGTPQPGALDRGGHRRWPALRRRGRRAHCGAPRTQRYARTGESRRLDSANALLRVGGGFCWGWSASARCRSSPTPRLLSSRGET
jgi:hypothetical protein